ncbi:MAG: hypothetical protein ABSB81_07255 [Halobacteriota archaeon]|jgi:hypothetical protein
MKYKSTLISIAVAALVLVSLCAVSASLSVAQGSSANVQAPALVGMSVVGAPAVCAENASNLFLFATGSDNQVHFRESTDGGVTWGAPQSIHGVATSSPAATVVGNTLHVFVRGTDGALYETSSAGGNAWALTWTKIGGQLLAGTGPAAYSFTSGATTQVGWLVTGTNHALYQQWSDNGVQSPSWKNLGGYLTSGPAASALPDGSQIGVSVRGGDGALWTRSTNYGGTTSWGSWNKIGGQLLAGTGPAQYSWTRGGLPEVGWLVTGTNHALYEWDHLNDWQNFGGYLTSSPAAATSHNASGEGTYLDVSVRGGDGGLWLKNYDAATNQWSGWTSIGGM